MATRVSKGRAQANFELARDQEIEGNIDAAIKLYHKAVSQNPILSAAYNRLMILYRKRKEYKKEPDIILLAINSFEDNLMENVQEWEDNNRKSAELSRNLAKSLGLLSAKGVPVYEDRQVAVWKKRKELVERKLKS